MRNCDKKESSYLNVNNLHEWAMSEKLPLGAFKWVKEISQFYEDSGKRYFLEINVQYPE